MPDFNFVDDTAAQNTVPPSRSSADTPSSTDAGERAEPRRQQDALQTPETAPPSRSQGGGRTPTPSSTPPSKSSFAGSPQQAQDGAPQSSPPAAPAPRITEPGQQSGRRSEAPPAAASAPASPRGTEGQVQLDDAGEMPDDLFIDDQPDETAVVLLKKKTRRWPLVGFVTMAVFLLALSFIWYWNPYPPLKNGIENLFRRGEPTVQRLPAAQKAVPPGDASVDTTGSSASAMPGVKDTSASEVGTAASREWDYWVQVSSWTELAKAQRDANLFRSRGINATTRSSPRMEGKPRRRVNWFRVRIGPFESIGRATLLRDSLAPSWKGAFVDSTRFDPSVPAVESPPIVQPAQRGAPAGSPITGSSTQSGPHSGFGVKVSSFRQEDIARAEANRLLKKGFPASVVKVQVASSEWYRVYVGPFKTKQEAEQYAKSIAASTGNDAYVIDFSVEKRK